MRSNTRYLVLMAVATVGLALTAPGSFAGHAPDGTDVKVTIDNNNVDGGTPNPGFDAANRQGNEPSVAISPADPNIVAAGGNDDRMIPVFLDQWQGLYVSSDAGATWFNTFVPGFPSDTSPAGVSSPLFGLDAVTDPVVRFDAAGNLYAAGIAFNEFFNPRPVDNVVFVAKYQYTPGSPGGVSTPSSAANPPNFTYAGTTVVARGAVGFALPPGQPFGSAGVFVDKEWLEVDTNTSTASPCAGSVYVTWTSFQGSLGGSFPIKFSRSTDGGQTFSHAVVISTGGQAGTLRNQGSDVAVAPDGTIYVAYRTFASGSDGSSISITKSTDCGKHWSPPVLVNTIVGGQAPGVAFRTPTWAFVATDDSDPDVVYVGYQNLGGDGDYDVFTQRSVDGGASWGLPVQVNMDPSNRNQIFPTIDVSNNALHVAWYDFRNSTTPNNEALDVFYACTNCDGVAWPTFSHEEKVTDVSHNGNCRLFGGFDAFHGDYIELDAYWTGSIHRVNIAWTDNRDVTPCDLDPTPGPPPDNTGNRNQNIYADTLTVSP